MELLTSSWPVTRVGLVVDVDVGVDVGVGVGVGVDVDVEDIALIEGVLNGAIMV